MAVWKDEMAQGGIEAGVIRELDALFRREVDMRTVNAKIEAQRVASQLGKNRRSVEGLGRVRMEVPTHVYHYWGRRLGYQCWKSKEFLREMERDNPELKVQCGGTKEIQVGFVGERKVRFKKVYQGEPSATSFLGPKKEAKKAA